MGMVDNPLRDNHGNNETALLLGRVWYQINFNVLMEVIKMLGLYTNTGKIIVVKYRTTLEAPV